MDTTLLDSYGALGHCGGDCLGDAQADQLDEVLLAEVRSVTPEAITRCGTVDTSQFQDLEREQWDDLTWAAACVRGESKDPTDYEVGARIRAFTMLSDLAIEGCSPVLRLAAANARREANLLDIGRRS